MSADFQSRKPAPREGYVAVDNAELSYREIGHGRPIIVIHGGSDFDRTYLLPDMDRLSDSYRLIYYDQRGRGKSRGDLRLEDISIEKYIEDLDSLRRHLQLDVVAILGHSWGGHVAMQYALHHPDCVSHMILMNTAPASHEDYLLIRQERLRRRAAHGERLNALESSPRYREGDPEAVAEYYEIAFGTAFKRPELVKRLNLRWTKEDVLRGRAIEERLMEGLYWSEGFTIIPELKKLRVPTLILHGDFDFDPVECATHLAEAILGARLVVLAESGHFSYIDAPKEAHKAIDEFFASA
jgi:proline iminopeptidase